MAEQTEEPSGVRTRLCDAGAVKLAPEPDPAYMRMAVDLVRSSPEDNARAGAVIVRGRTVIATGYKGEDGPATRRQWRLRRLPVRIYAMRWHT